MARKLFFIVFFLMMVSLLSPFFAVAEMQCTQSMEITEPRYGITAEVGVEVSFSDIGCAVIWRNLQCAMDQMEFDASAMAHDHETSEEVTMADAFFAVGCGLKTPMNYGIAAFKHREDAEAFAAKHDDCKVLSFDELVELGLK